MASSKFSAAARIPKPRRAAASQNAAIQSIVANLFPQLVPYLEFSGPHCAWSSGAFMPRLVLHTSEAAAAATLSQLATRILNLRDE